jgi:TonB-like protein
MNSRALRLSCVVLFAMAGFGCRSDLLKEDRAANPDLGVTARVEVAASECPGQARLLNAPEHCAWQRMRSSRVMSSEVDLSAVVDADGTTKSVKVAGESAGEEIDSAAVACAMQATYEPARDESGAPVAGETCPFRMKLVRYPSDVSPRAAVDCPSAGVVVPGQTSGGATDPACPGNW